MNLQNRKIIVVLSGGGAVGSAQWGVLRQMKKLGVPIHAIFGISVGTLNGSMVAMEEWELLDELWNSVIEKGHTVIYDSKYLTVEGSKLNVNVDALVKDIAPKLSFDTIWKLLSKKGRDKLVKEVFERAGEIKSIASNQPLQNLLTNYIDQSKFKIPFYFGSVSLADGNYHLHTPADFPNNSNLVKGLTASATMPLVWEPIAEIQTNYETIYNAVDGGLRTISPLGDAVNYIQNISKTDPVDAEIIIINCNNGKVDPLTGNMNLFTIANRSLNEITLSQILLNDIQQFIRINNMVVQSPVELLSSTGKEYKAFKYRIIQPEDSSLSGVLDFSPEMLLKRKQWGELQALKTFQDFQ
jgi:NTE family protein